MARRRLIWQLYPSYLIVVLVAVVAIGWTASHAFRRDYLDHLASDLGLRAKLAEPLVREALASGDMARVNAVCNRLGESAQTRFTVILPSGKVAGDSEAAPSEMENHSDRPEIIKALRGRVGVETRPSPTLNEVMMYVAAPMREGDRIVAVLRVAIPATEIDETLAAIRNRIALWGLVIAGLAALVCLAISRWISRPIEEIRRGAERFAAGDMTQRLVLPKTAELAALARALNQAAVGIQERIRAITRERNQQEAILASMIEAVLVVDMDERVTDMNRAAAQLLEVEHEAVQGRTIQETIRNPDLLVFVARALSADRAVEGDIVLRGGGERFLQAHGSELAGAQGQRIGALIVLNDVTRLLQLENVRRDFVANVSHELKTPITAIKASVETLQDGAVDSPDDARRFLGMILRQADRLNAIVDDLLRLSRIESGESALTLTEGPLQPSLAAAIQTCEPAASEKGIRIELQCDEGVRTHRDPQQIEQAVTNLVDNAVKYGPNDSRVLITARSDGEEVSIAVADEGPGIAKEHLPRIFERFYRVDKGRDRNLGGTGLGLAIVKHIALAHHGRVSVVSEPGRGSVFTIHLPGIGHRSQDSQA